MNGRISFFLISICSVKLARYIMYACLSLFRFLSFKKLKALKFEQNFLLFGFRCVWVLTASNWNPFIQHHVTSRVIRHDEQCTIVSNVVRVALLGTKRNGMCSGKRRSSQCGYLCSKHQAHSFPVSSSSISRVFSVQKNSVVC